MEDWHKWTPNEDREEFEVLFESKVVNKVYGTSYINIRRDIESEVTGSIFRKSYTK